MSQNSDIKALFLPCVFKQYKCSNSKYMKKYFVVCSLICGVAFAQNTDKVVTSDIDRFWAAYDLIQNTPDESEKLRLINDLYLSKQTKGLKAFREARNYTDTLYVQLINEYPKFWNSIRPNTLTIKNKTAELNEAVEKLRQYYPDLKDAEMYFTIGGLRSGGTVADRMVLVGAEIATGTATVDVSEFKDNWLRNAFSRQTLDNIVYLNLHEYIHTQQDGGNNRVLNQSIKEGSCDFIAELVLGSPIQTAYLTYGRLHEQQVQQLFKQEMFSHNTANWLYNGKRKAKGYDLGYYVGYEICRAYYDKATDKQLAVKDIIELNYSDNKAVEDFLFRSGYFKEKINTKKLLKAYHKKLPYVVKTGPFKNGSRNVAADTKEVAINFSAEMDPNSMSISYSDKGREYFPITKIKGFENNNTTLVLFMELQPGKEYEFIVTNRDFKSKDGYPLRDEAYTVSFQTK